MQLDPLRPGAVSTRRARCITQCASTLIALTALCEATWAQAQKSSNNVRTTPGSNQTSSLPKAGPPKSPSTESAPKPPAKRHATGEVLAAVTSTPAPDISIEYEKLTLANGLEVILHHDSTLPLVAVSVWYHVGPVNEPPKRSGFAH